VNRLEDVTLRALLIAIVLVVLINVWMLHTELVSGRYVTAGIPPIPAVGVLLLLVGLNPLLGRLGKRVALRRAEVLVIYVFLTVGLAITATYGVRAIFPFWTALRYYATPENGFAELADLLPRWLVPDDPNLIRTCYEGSEDGSVPWAAWLPYLLRWGGFFLTFFFTILCLLTVLRRQWTERDRLTFPLLYLPLELTQTEGERALGAAFFRNPVMWLGFGAAAFYNLLNILHAFNPAVVSLRPDIPVSGFFPNRPLTPLGSMSITLRPELIGFAYLVPSDILFSTWFCYFLNRAMAVIGLAWGYDVPGLPFTHEQSTGSYLALGLLLLWMGRGQIKEVLRGAVGKWEIAYCKLPIANRVDAAEGLPYWLAVWGGLAGMVALLLWLHYGGIKLWIAAAYLAILLCFVLVYSRIRAEAGVAIDFIYPYGQPKHLLVNTLGMSNLVRWGGRSTVVSLSVFYFLARFHFIEWSGAYQTDGLRLADLTGIRQRRMALVLFLALVVGFVCACWAHFTAYYEYGQNCIEGRSVEADWRTRVALGEFEAMGRAIQTGGPPDWLRTRYVGLGLGFTLALGVARRVFLRFPVHPLGFVLATAYGDYCPIWASFLLVWAIKIALMRLGGVHVYRKILPFFLGLVIGHFFVGGFVWSTLSVFIDSDVAHQYYTIFG